jgi:hypothetical protein
LQEVLFHDRWCRFTRQLTPSKPAAERAFFRLQVWALRQLRPIAGAAVIAI